MGDRNNGTLSLDRPGGEEISDQFCLRPAHQECSRDGAADCDAPLPGRPHRFEAEQQPGGALAVESGASYVDTAPCDADDSAFQRKLTGDGVRSAYPATTGYGPEMLPGKGLIGGNGRSSGRR